MFFTAILITYIKGGTPAQIVLEKGFAMTRAIVLPKLSSFIDWCCFYAQVGYAGFWEPLVKMCLLSYQQPVVKSFIIWAQIMRDGIDD